MARKRHYRRHSKAGEKHHKKLKRSSHKCKVLRKRIATAHTRHARGKALGAFRRRCR